MFDDGKTPSDIAIDRAMYKAWVDASGETNTNQLEHLKNCIHVAIDEWLTEHQRKYLGLYLSGYNTTEMAEITGVNCATVSRTLHRGLRRLMGRVKYATPSTLYADENATRRLMRLYK